MRDPDCDYRFQVWFRRTNGIIAATFPAAAGACWWTLRQNVHDGVHTSPPFSKYGEADLCGFNLDVAECGVIAEVSGFVGPVSDELAQQFELAPAGVWVAIVDGRRHLRWVDDETWKAQGRRLTFPPEMPAPTIQRPADLPPLGHKLKTFKPPIEIVRHLAHQKLRQAPGDGASISDNAGA